MVSFFFVKPTVHVNFKNLSIFYLANTSTNPYAYTTIFILAVSQSTFLYVYELSSSYKQKKLVQMKKFYDDPWQLKLDLPQNWIYLCISCKSDKAQQICLKDFLEIHRQIRFYIQANSSCYRSFPIAVDFFMGSYGKRHAQRLSVATYLTTLLYYPHCHIYDVTIENLCTFS